MFGVGVDYLIDIGDWVKANIDLIKRRIFSMSRIFGEKRSKP